MRTLFLRLVSENGSSFLCPVIIRVTCRSTEQSVGQGNSAVELLFNKKTAKIIFCRFFHLILHYWMARFGCFMMKSWFLSNRLVLFLEDKLIVLLLEDTSFFVPGKKKALTQFSLKSTPLIRTLSSHSNLFSRTLSVATVWTYKSKFTICFLHSLHFDPKDLLIKQGVARHVMHL